MSKDQVVRMKEQFSPQEIKAITDLKTDQELTWYVGKLLYDKLTLAVPEVKELDYIGCVRNKDNIYTGAIDIVCAKKLGTMSPMLWLMLMEKIEVVAEMYGGVYDDNERQWGRSDDAVCLGDSPLAGVYTEIITLQDTDYEALESEYNHLYTLSYQPKPMTKKQQDRYDEIDNINKSMRALYTFGYSGYHGKVRSVKSLSANAQKVIGNKIKHGENCWAYTTLTMCLNKDEHKKTQTRLFAFQKLTAKIQANITTAGKITKTELQSPTPPTLVIPPVEIQIPPVETKGEILPLIAEMKSIPTGSGETVNIGGILKELGKVNKYDIAEFDTPVIITRVKKGVK